MPRCPRLVAVARAGGAREAGVLRRRALLGPAGAGVRRPRCRGARRRAGARRARRQPHRADVHRRPVRRLAVRLAAPGRPRQPADRRQPRTTGCVLRGTRIVAAVRCAPPDNKPTTEEKRTVRHLARPRAARSWRRTLRCVARARLVRAGTRRSAAVRAPGGRCRRPKPRFGHGAEAVLASAARRRACCSAATTPASRTPSPAGSPSRCSTRSWAGRRASSRGEVVPPLGLEPRLNRF